MAWRITAGCLLVAVLAVLVAGLVSVRLIAVTAREVTQAALARQADVLAAQTVDGPGGAVGVRGAAAALRGQGVDVLVVGPGRLDPTPTGSTAAALATTDVTRVLDGLPVSATAEVGARTLVVEARPAGDGGFALVQPVDRAVGVGPQLRRSVLFALLAGAATALVVGFVVAHLLARPLRGAVAGATALRSGRRDVRIPERGPTEIAEVAGAVNELADALAHSEARQRAFLLSVSHELRTPLTAVRGFAESLADGVVSGDEVPEVGRVVLREAERLNRLVDDLMELARLQADDFRLDPAPVDLAGLAREAAEVWAARSAAAGVEFRVEAAGPAVVRADPRRLRQVVDGLAENALRVLPPGAPLVLAVRPVPGGGVLEVRDGGPGLSDDDYAVAFAPGVLHERYRERRGTGGIGLALVHGLVTRMGGRIDATPAPEGGARFTVTLPAP
ncbi:HAMP domain-containing histidine kinase [Pseudonocardia sp. S2-4]|uniref:histidine kinase n=1 Tax=Pseudonocardia humida TaxID=2800819 RepID=A0ABT1AAQ9_9PSEU|nr:HAMP domain-containing histidine kinase [Pseudonocardia humida]